VNAAEKMLYWERVFEASLRDEMPGAVESGIVQNVEIQFFAVAESKGETGVTFPFKPVVYRVGKRRTPHF
jgi:hypothetical protein